MLSRGASLARWEGFPYVQVSTLDRIFLPFVPASSLLRRLSMVRIIPSFAVDDEV